VKMGFLNHKPDTELVGRDLIENLGVELIECEYGPFIKKSEPFQETNVKGVLQLGMQDPYSNQ
jgi:hypothetical protein